MSWDADLITELDGKEILVSSDCDWNYTHNTNCMINAVIEDTEKDLGDAWTPIRERDESWWHSLDGMSTKTGIWFLERIIGGLEDDPDRFRAMNPNNGWGSYDSLLVVLRDMLKQSREWPSAKWRVNG